MYYPRISLDCCSNPSMYNFYDLNRPQSWRLDCSMYLNVTPKRLITRSEIFKFKY